MMLKRKKAICLVILCILFMNLFPRYVQAKEIKKPNQLKSHHAFVVIDAKSDEALMYNHADTKIYPASTTKLMTAIVILEQMQNKNIHLDEEGK